MGVYNVTESIKAQKKYSEEFKVPHFAPKSGICWSCNRNIYEPFAQERTLYWEDGKPVKKTFTTGITTEKAGKHLVTGCPHCNRSYCD